MSSEKHLELREHKYVSGQIIAREFYQNGKLKGIKLWHENGRLWNSMSYRNGIKEGKHEWWSANGRILTKEFFRDGKKAENINGTMKMVNSVFMSFIGMAKAIILLIKIRTHF